MDEPSSRLRVPALELSAASHLVPRWMDGQGGMLGLGRCLPRLLLCLLQDLL